jgi:phospholipid N-methyltransferase
MTQQNRWILPPNYPLQAQSPLLNSAMPPAITPPVPLPDPQESGNWWETPATMKPYTTQRQEMIQKLQQDRLRRRQAANAALGTYGAQPANGLPPVPGMDDAAVRQQLEMQARQIDAYQRRQQQQQQPAQQPANLWQTLSRSPIMKATPGGQIFSGLLSLGDTARSGQAPGWMAPADSWIGKDQRELARAFKPAAEATNAWDAGAELIKGTAGQSAAAQLPTAWEAFKARPALDTAGGLAFAAMGARMTPIMPRQLFNVLNLPMQAYEGVLGAMDNIKPKGPIGRGVEITTPALGFTRAVSNFAANYDDWSKLPPEEAYKNQLKRQYLFTDGPTLEQKAQQWAAQLPEDYGAQYRAQRTGENRGPFQTIGDLATGRDTMTSAVGKGLNTLLGASDPVKHALQMSANISFSGEDARMRAVKRITTGEHWDAVINGMQMPGKDAFDDEKERFTRSYQDYVTSAGRIATTTALSTGASRRQAETAARQAMAEADQIVKATGMIPGEVNPMGEMVGQTLMSFSPLDPMAKVPLHRLFGTSHLVPAENAKRQASWLDQVYDPAAKDTAGLSMKQRFNEAYTGLPTGTKTRADRMADVVEDAKSNPAMKQAARWYLTYAKGRGYTEATKAHIMDGHALNVLSELALRSRSVGELQENIGKFYAAPDELVPQFGNMPISVRAQFARPIIEALGDNILNLPSMQDLGAPVDFGRFLNEVAPITAEAARTINGVKPLAERSGLEKLAFHQKQLMGEFFLRTPGYIFRNAMSDTVIAAQDGLLAREGYNDILSHLQKMGIQPADVVGGKFGFDGEDHAGNYPSIFNSERIPEPIRTMVKPIAKWQDFMGDKASALENQRRVRSYYAAITKLWPKQWKPSFDDATRGALSPISPLLDQLEHASRTAGNEQELRDAWQRIIKPAHAGDTFMPTQYLDKAGLTHDVVPQPMLVEMMGEVRRLAEEGADENAINATFQKYEDAILDQRNKAVANMGNVVHPRQDTAGMVEQDMQDFTSGLTKSAQDMARVGMITPAELQDFTKLVNDDLMPGETQIKDARASLFKAIQNIDDKTDIGQLMRLMQYTMNREYGERNNYRTTQGRLETEMRGTLEKIMNGKGSKAAKAQMMRAALDEYRQKNGANAKGMHGKVLDTHKWAGDTLPELIKDPSRWDELIGDRFNIETGEASADWLMGQMRKSLDEGGLQGFRRDLTNNRFRIDVPRREAWRQAMSITKAEPQLTTDVLDVLLASERSVQDNAIQTVMKNRLLLGAKDLGKMGFSDYAKAVNENWTQHFDFAQHVYGDVSASRLQWMQIRKSPMAAGLRKLGYQDAEIANLLSGINSASGRAQIEQALTGPSKQEAGARVPDVAVEDMARSAQGVPPRQPGTEPAAQPVAPRPQPQPFKATAEWQDAPAGVPMPAGLEYKMNLDTGTAQVRDPRATTPEAARPVEAPAVDAATPQPEPPPIERPAPAPTTRERFMQHVDEQYPDLQPAERTAMNAIYDARANVWARRNGRTPEEYYQRRLRTAGDGIDLNQDAGQNIRGATSFDEQGRALIRGFKGADLGTLAEETGHVFARDLEGEDAQTAAQFMGFKDAEELTGLRQQFDAGQLSGDTEARYRAGEEKFARAWQEYLKDGNAPTEGLRKVFEQLKQMLVQVYAKMRGYLRDEITPEMRGVFDRLLSEDIEANKAPATADDYIQRQTIPAGMNERQAVDWLASDAAHKAQQMREQAESLTAGADADLQTLLERRKGLPGAFVVNNWISSRETGSKPKQRRGPTSGKLMNWLESGDPFDFSQKVEQYPELKSRNAEGATGGEAQIWYDFLKEAQAVHNRIRDLKNTAVQRDTLAKQSVDAAGQWARVQAEMESARDAINKRPLAEATLANVIRQSLADAGGDMDAIIPRWMDYADANPAQAKLVMDTMQQIDQPAAMPAAVEAQPDAAMPAIEQPAEVAPEIAAPEAAPVEAQQPAVEQPTMPEAAPVEAQQPAADWATRPDMGWYRNADDEIVYTSAVDARLGGMRQASAGQVESETGKTPDTLTPDEITPYLSKSFAGADAEQATLSAPKPEMPMKPAAEQPKPLAVLQSDTYGTIEILRRTPAGEYEIRTQRGGMDIQTAAEIKKIAKGFDPAAIAREIVLRQSDAGIQPGEIGAEIIDQAEGRKPKSKPASGTLGTRVMAMIEQAKQEQAAQPEAAPAGGLFDQQPAPDAAMPMPEATAQPEQPTSTGSGQADLFGQHTQRIEQAADKLATTLESATQRIEAALQPKNAEPVEAGDEVQLRDGRMLRVENAGGPPFYGRDPEGNRVQFFRGDVEGITKPMFADGAPTAAAMPEAPKPAPAEQVKQIIADAQAGKLPVEQARAQIEQIAEEGRKNPDGDVFVIRREGDGYQVYTEDGTPTHYSGKTADEAERMLMDNQKVRDVRIEEPQFDSAKWNQERDDRIKASRAAGNVHLDNVSIDTSLRGRQIYSVHDPKERGVIRTTINHAGDMSSGSVMVDWVDKYSADQNLATLTKEGKKTVYRSILGQSDFKDYALDGSGRAEVPNVQEAAPAATKAKPYTIEPYPYAKNSIVVKVSSFDDSANPAVRYAAEKVGGKYIGRADGHVIPASKRAAFIREFEAVQARTEARKQGETLQPTFEAEQPTAAPPEAAPQVDAGAPVVQDEAMQTAPATQPETASPEATQPAADQQFTQYTNTPRQPQNFVAKREQTSFGPVYRAYYEDGTPAYMGAETLEGLKTMLDENYIVQDLRVDEGAPAVTPKIGDTFEWGAQSRPTRGTVARIDGDKVTMLVSSGRDATVTSDVPVGMLRRPGEAQTTTPAETPAAAPEAAQPAAQTTQPVEGGVFNMHRRHVNDFIAGKMNAEQWKAAYEQFMSSIEQYRAELNQKTVKELTARSGIKKSEAIKNIIDQVMARYALGDSISYNPFSENWAGAVREAVYSITDADVQTYLKKVEDKKATHEKALANPETLDEFRMFINRKGESALTTEQRAAYDALVAKGQQQMTANKTQQQITQRAAGTTGIDMGGATMSIKETMHTRDKTPLFVVQMSTRVPPETYQALNKRAKMLGGHYSSFIKADSGFQFKSRETAEKFLQLDASPAEAAIARTEERAQTSQQIAAEKMRGLADRLEAAGNEEMTRERKENTHKRADQAAHAQAQAASDVALARTIRRLADAIESGEAQFLTGITARTQVETLDKTLRRAQRNRFQAEKISYGDQERETLGVRDVDFAQYPYPWIHKTHLLTAAAALEKVNGEKMLGKRLRKLAERMSDQDAGAYVKSEMDIKDIASAASVLKGGSLNRDNKYAGQMLSDNLDDYLRLKAAGIETDHQLRAALREYMTYKSAKPEGDKIRALQRQTIGMKLPGYFPTPTALAQNVVEMADIQPGMSVLEPSAGQGHLVDAIKQNAPDAKIDAVELAGTNREILQAKGVNLVGQNFLEHEAGQQYDRIVMNPPFGNSMGDGTSLVEIDHVMRAFDMLKPGGKLVAIVGEGPFFNSNAKAEDFRNWLDGMGASYEKLPEGSFKDSDRSTGVNTRVIVIDKPGEAMPAKQPQFKYEDYSAFSRQLAMTKTPDELREMIGQAEYEGGKASKTRLNVLESRGRDTWGGSQRNAQASNVVGAAGETKMAAKSALDLYEEYPQYTKLGGQKPPEVMPREPEAPKFKMGDMVTYDGKTYEVGFVGGDGGRRMRLQDPVTKEGSLQVYPDQVQPAMPEQAQPMNEAPAATAMARQPAGQGQPNKVIRIVNGKDGQQIGIISRDYDGSEAGAQRAANEINDEMEQRYPYPQSSNIQSKTGATDETGAAKFVIAPNGRISQARTADARYALGDLNAKAEMPAEGAPMEQPMQDAAPAQAGQNADVINSPISPPILSAPTEQAPAPEMRDVVQSSMLGGVADQQESIAGQQSGMFGEKTARNINDLRKEYNTLLRAQKMGGPQAANVEARLRDVNNQARAQGVDFEKEPAPPAGGLFDQQQGGPPSLFQEFDPEIIRNQDEAVEKGQQEGIHFTDLTDAASQDALRGVRTIRDGFKEHIKNAPLDRNITPAQQAQLSKELEKFIGNFYDTRRNTMEQAKSLTNFTLLDYAQKRGFDQMLSLVAPFSYWGTRQGRNYLIRFMSDPRLLTSYLRYRYAMEDQNKKDGVRGRFGASVKIPLSSISGGHLWDVYVDPMMAFFPFAGMVQADMNDGQQSRTAFQEAYDRASVLGFRPAPMIDIPMRMSNAMVTKQPGEEGYNQEMAAYGAPSVGQLIPQTGVVQGLTAAAGLGGPTGVDIERPIRKLAGLPEGEQWDAYRIARSVADIAAYNQKQAGQAGGQFDNKPYLVAQEFIKAHGQTDLPEALQSYTPDKLASEMQVPQDVAAQALQIAREGARIATQQRGFSQLASVLGGQRMMQLPEGEKARWNMRGQERAAAYNPLTGTGSREQAQQVQQANPALAVQRVQYGALPGDEKDYRYMYDQAVRSEINMQFDALKDSVIQSKPWDRKAARQIENARYNALGTVQDRAAKDRPDAGGQWQREYQKAVAELTGQGMPPETMREYRPRSTAGASPAEALQIRKDEVLRYVMNTQPDFESFQGDDGTTDYDAYNAAKAEWAKKLATIAVGVPQVAQILAKADAEKQGGAIRKWLATIGEDDLAAYRRRNDTPLEAAQRVYFDQVYAPTMAAYRQARDNADPQAYENTIGKVGAISGDTLMPLIQETYGDRFNEAELAQDVARLKMPAMADIMKENRTPAARVKSQAQEEFWNYIRTNTPPGGQGYPLRQQPLIAAALDPSSRRTLTAEQYKLALSMARGWVNEQYGEAAPEMQQEWQAARAAKAQFDTLVVSRFGRDGLAVLQKYERIRSGDEKEALRERNPALDQVLMLRAQFAQANPAYAAYYRGAEKVAKKKRKAVQVMPAELTQPAEGG